VSSCVPKMATQVRYIQCQFHNIVPWWRCLYYSDLRTLAVVQQNTILIFDLTTVVSPAEDVAIAKSLH
jgi:hypothetical protein